MARTIIRRTAPWLLLVAFCSGISWLVFAQEAAPSGFEAYSLQYAPAADAAAKLKDVLAQFGTTHEVVTDRQGNRILVRGSEDIQRMAKQMLLTLDRPASAPPVPAAAQATVVRGYRVPTESLDAALADLRKRFPASSGARIAPDPRTQQVVVVAPEEIQRQIAQTLEGAPAAEPKAASKKPAARPLEGSEYQLQHISWRDLEDGLRRVWGNRLVAQSQGAGESVVVATQNGPTPQPVLQIDRRRDTLRFLGPPATMQTWSRVVQALDKPRNPVNQDTELLPLNRANPQQVQRAVELLRSAANDPAATVMRSAPGEAARVAKLASMIFQAKGEGAAAPAAPAPAAPATPTPAAPPAGPPPTAPAAAPEGEGPAKAEAPGDDDAPEGGGLIGSVQIEFLDGLDAIVIRGHKRDVERVRKIIEDIEKLSLETQPAIEIVHLRFVGSQALNDLVLQLYDEILAARQGRVAIRALVKPNALLLIGAPESVKFIKSLIAKLDQPVAPETQFEVFRLKYVSAVDVEQTVRNFFVDRLSGVGGVTTGITGFGGAPTAAGGAARPGLGTRVNVVSDFRTNSLIVTAAARDLAEVRQLITRLDVEAGDASNELRIFRLKNAMASDVAPVLQDALNWQLIGNRAPLGATGTMGAFGGAAFGAGIGQQQERARLRNAALTFMTVDSEKGKLLESGILSDVRVTADYNGNALIVTGPSKSMGLIEALIKELDHLPNAQAAIKVFSIVNGDATTLANMLRTLLGQTSQTTTGGGAFGAGGLFGTGAVNPFLSPAMQSAASIGESSLVPIRFGVDQRTNSIVVSGSDGDLGVVEAILLRLDAESFREHKTTVYWLANTQATQVATAVNNWLTQRQTLLQQRVTAAPESPDVRYYRQVIVVAEAASNSIIISAMPQVFEEVKHVVQALDRRPLLVKVDVLIAQVTLTSGSEFGAEFGLQDSLLFNRTALTGTNKAVGYNFNNKPLGDNGPAADAGKLLGQAITSLDVGRLSSGATYGGLVLSASRDSISALLRALELEGRAQILSRPQITTLDNQGANVNVGEVTARPGNTTVNANTTTQAVNDTNVGLLLGVTPRVTPDGLIVLEIDAEKSRLDYTRSVTVNGNDIPNIASVTASTTVSARSGQTVVFAGLIETTTEQEVRGIPFLRKLPLAGPLFEFRADRTERRELLIIMTPYLIRSDDDLDMIRQSESERMSWCLADVAEVYGAEGFSARPGCWCHTKPCRCGRIHRTEVVYPDTNPSGVIDPPSPAPPAEDPAPQPSIMAPAKPPVIIPRQTATPSPTVAPASSRRTQQPTEAPPQAFYGPTPTPYGPLPAGQQRIPAPSPMPEQPVAPAGYQYDAPPSGVAPTSYTAPAPRRMPAAP